jgi:hypothetical protein
VLTAALAESFAGIALGNVAREYPGKPDHVLAGDARRTPAARVASRVLRQLRLALVRAHALAARARAPPVPAVARTAAIDDVFDRHLTPGNIAPECAISRAGSTCLRAHVRMGVASEACARAAAWQR